MGAAADLALGLQEILQEIWVAVPFFVRMRQEPMPIARS
jgi:hypothetical protein